MYWLAKIRRSVFTEAATHRCSYVNLLHIFRTTFLKNTSGWPFLYLDKALNFNLPRKEKMSKAMRETGVFQKLRKSLPWHFLITIFKSFARPYLEYSDIIYDQPNNESFTLKRIQYNAALTNTSATERTSQSKLCSELGFESLKFSRWFRKLCTFLKLKTIVLPE